MVDAQATILNTVSAINYFIWNTPAEPTGPRPPVTRIMAMPAPKDIYCDFEERFGIRFIEGYGLTETGMVTYHPPGAPPRPGSCGVATPGFEVTRGRARHRPAAPAPAPRARSWWTCACPTSSCATYAGMPEKTAEDFRNLKLHTGDLGLMDADGLPLLPRPGEGLHPPARRERQLDGGRGRPDRATPTCSRRPPWGCKAGEGASSEDEILVCVVLREGSAPDPGELLDWCTERMPYFAVPRYLRVMDHAAEDAHRAGAQGGAARGRGHPGHLRPLARMSGDLDLGEAVDYILSERPRLDEDVSGPC